VLQEGEVERVGGTKSRHLNVRIIAATNVDLEAAVARGEFRQDLLFRLNVFPIAIPPLRERREDIPVLAEYFVRRYCGIHNQQRTGFTERALEALLSYAWPGNVREIENVVERAIILSSAGGAMDISHLPPAVAGRGANAFTPGGVSQGQPRLAAASGWANSDARSAIALAAPAVPLNRMAAEELQEILTRYRWNLSSAAKALGVTRAQIAYRVKKLGLDDAPSVIARGNG